VGAAAALLCSCATTASPEHVAARYAEALRDGQLDAAYALLDEGTRPGVAEFRATYAAAEARRDRADAILKSLAGMRASSGEVELVWQGGDWRVADPSPDVVALKVLKRFLTAVEARDFETVYGCLAQTWRDRYTPARLEKDFALEPQAKDRVARVRAALARKGLVVEVSREGVQFPLGEGRAVRLVREAGDYRIAALE
jgi:hypothetical protein